MQEKQIEDWLTKQVQKLGGLSFKFVSPGNPGVPDRIYLLPGGRVYFVELKQELGRLSNIQRWQRERFRGMGCEFHVVKGMTSAKEFVCRLKEELKGNGVQATRLSTAGD